MPQAVRDRLAQTRVGLHFLFCELGLEPSVEGIHHRLAVLLVEAQPLFGREALFLGLRIIAVDLAEAFQHELALLGKVGRHLDKATPSVRVIWGPRLRALSRQWNYPECGWRSVGRWAWKGC